MGVTEMRDVVAHYVCSSDPNSDVSSLEDVERGMAALGFGRTERFETSEGSWMRFLPDHGHGHGHDHDHGRHLSESAADSPCKSASEYAYELKLPIHLHVVPRPDLHFGPFFQALRFFTADRTNKPQPFHLKNVDCEAQRCRYWVSCKELYGMQRAPSCVKEY